MSKLNLKKFKCGGCTEIILTNEFTRECWSCGSTLLEKQEIIVGDYLKFAHDELENANYHNQVDLPEKLFDEIRANNLLGGDESYELELSRIIAEEFYNNI